MRRLISRLVPRFGLRKTAPAHPEIVRARQLLRSGQPDQAMQICNRVLAVDPENAEACNILGGITLQQGRADLAARYFSQAVAIDPGHPGYLQGLGIAHCNLKQLPEAVRSFQQALTLDPKNPAAHSNLGNCYKQDGNLADATRCHRKAIAADSAYLPAYINLADILEQQLEHKAAVKTYRKALRIAADTPDNRTNRVLLHHRLGLALRQLDKTDEAIAHYREAITLQPEFAMAHNSLGGALLARNEPEAALACFKKALELEPGYARVHSNVLMTMNYLSGVSQEQIYRASLEFAAQHAARLMRGRAPLRNIRNKQRVLKIGYLSPDFREHSVAHFTRKLIGAHDRNAVEVTCYADVAAPDDWTGQFQTQADHWVPVTDMQDEEVVTRIRDDGIDILVDLAGHTSKNRMLVFARKPAPVQVSWLGYPNTTGMKAMDYRLTDAVADPPGEADRLHSEKLIRLEHGFLCFQTEESVPGVSPPPCLQQEHVTFGSFNTIKKVTPEVIDTWSRMLLSVPNARLVMKSSALEDATTKKNLLQAFADCGIDRDRLDLINAVPHRKKHLALYAKIDIALDPFPYNGTTTTFEALWMGVPVVTLCGDRHAGRVGASILQHLELPALIADNENDYIGLAKELAGDRQRLVTLRNTLRSRMCESVLMDVSLFASTLENAYRNMWITWCNKRK